jgi:hypothetical protein
MIRSAGKRKVDGSRVVLDYEAAYWGRFGPLQRYNVDQIPMPFVLKGGGKDTWDFVGNTHVQVRSNVLHPLLLLIVTDWVIVDMN